jgi:hypothetical protein
MKNVQTKYDTGEKYSPDDSFKAAARLHQSKYRAEILNVHFEKYCSKLLEADGQKLLNYYDRLDVREIKWKRFPKYSHKRDADMLRSEHIPFNLFAPLVNRTDLAQHILNALLSGKFDPPKRIVFEWAPKPPQNYLNDHTSFDAYIEARDDREQLTGIGIEVKYTERGYRIGGTEKNRMNNPDSLYWKVTRESYVFRDNRSQILFDDDVRQIWRNHLLGLAMKQAGIVDQFILLTVYPAGNHYMAKSISRYREMLTNEGKKSCLGLTFEDYIASIYGGDDIMEWKEYLQKRYIVEPSGYQ